MTIYELIIVGGGPAGITAAIYSARKRVNFVLITKDIGGKAAWSANIENYTGYQFITGSELAQKFEEHVRAFNITILFEDAKHIEKIPEGFEVQTTRGRYKSRSVIVATGTEPKKLGVPGEDEFKNRGVTYCATCDAPLFMNKNVAVIGGGNAGLDATLQLTRIARQIYLIEISSELKGDKIMKEKVIQSDKVAILTNTKVLEILGNRFVKEIVVEREGKKFTLPVDGVFIEIGQIPNSDIVRHLVELNEKGEIIVDARCRTNVDGLFAAGDVTNVPQKQIVVAAGEGAKAAISAYEYLQRLKQ
ncbi:MAG: FAD-dependent oxidoreductase [Candidatus Hadarchaeales archaeon]